LEVVNYGDVGRPNGINALDATDIGFYDGLKRNTTIHKLELNNNDSIVRGVGHEILKAYQENNNLTHLQIRLADLRSGGEHVITKTLRSCTNLKEFRLIDSHMTGEQLLPIVEAVREHHSLEVLYLVGNGIDNAGCGEAIATLLEDPNSNLHTLNLEENLIGNDGAIALTNSLANNTKLRKLYLQSNPIDQNSMWKAIAKLICNTASINDIYDSNHTLESLLITRLMRQPAPQKLNRGTNKSHVAIKKILQYHPNFDMDSFFE
jgi:Ran GTPase-activating protein (RanGAP) involved in mRNA processing and transport